MKRKLYFILYSLIILIIIILADLDLLPLHLLLKIPHYDWMAHLVLYGFFYSLLKRLLNDRKVSLCRRSIESAFFISAMFITIEEFSQLFLPSRTFSLMDLFMGFLGIFLFRLRLMKFSCK